MWTGSVPRFINIKVLFYSSLIELKFANRCSTVTTLDMLVVIALDAPFYNVMFWIVFSRKFHIKMPVLNNLRSLGITLHFPSCDTSIWDSFEFIYPFKYVFLHNHISLSSQPSSATGPNEKLWVKHCSVCTDRAESHLWRSMCSLCEHGKSTAIFMTKNIKTPSYIRLLAFLVWQWNSHSEDSKMKRLGCWMSAWLKYTEVRGRGGFTHTDK